MILTRDLDTPFGTYAAGTPLHVIDTIDDYVTVELGTDRVPNPYPIPASLVGGDPVRVSCDCGRDTIAGHRSGRCIACYIADGYAAEILARHAQLLSARRAANRRYNLGRAS